MFNRSDILKKMDKENRIAIARERTLAAVFKAEEFEANLQKYNENIEILFLYKQVYAHAMKPRVSFFGKVLSPNCHVTVESMIAKANYFPRALESVCWNLAKELYRFIPDSKLVLTKEVKSELEINPRLRKYLKRLYPDFYAGIEETFGTTVINSIPSLKFRK